MRDKTERYVRKRFNAQGGFSLVEVLVALAIAAMLAVVLTRFASNTRSNAARIREQVTMMSLANYLLERTSLEKPAAGEGRSAGFLWQMRKDSLPFKATAQKMLPKEAGSRTNTGSSTLPGAANPASSGPASSSISSGGSPSPAGTAGAPTQPKPLPSNQQWTPVHVTVFIQAPSGRRYSADTIRLESADDDEARTKDN